MSENTKKIKLKKDKRRHHFYLQSEIEEAMRNTKSNRQAAGYLGLSEETYRKYASMYFDENGVNLYQKHKNQSGRGCQKVFEQYADRKYSLDAILAGKFPQYPKDKLKILLVRSGIMEEKCNLCGFNEQRVTDKKVPLLLTHADGDPTNYAIENLELVCYNCYFLTVGDIILKKRL